MRLLVYWLLWKTMFAYPIREFFPSRYQPYCGRNDFVDNICGIGAKTARETGTFLKSINDGLELKK